MHRIISFLLIICMLSTAFSRWMLFAGYEMNRGYIAAELCINKAKPIMHCNGKCYLKKKIKEEDQAQQKQQRSSFKSVFAEALIGSDHGFKCYVHQTGEFIAGYKTHCSFNVSGSVFHPPPLS